jgi:hypothetical protein
MNVGVKVFNGLVGEIADRHAKATAITNHIARDQVGKPCIMRPGFVKNKIADQIIM